MAKFYFDITETFIKTVAIEADSLELAMKCAEKAYHNDEIEIDHTICDDLSFICRNEDELLSNELTEVDAIDGSELRYNPEQDGYCCSVCGSFIVSRDDERDWDFKLPSHCPDCGQTLK